MDRVYVLQHVSIAPTEEETQLIIGVYRTREAAEQARARAEKLPGFRDAKGDFLDTGEGFHIADIPLDKDHWTEGFFTVVTKVDED